eukprot:scaffold5108_cov172-Amphora_coffeaeformis.AAC.12
MKSILFLLAAAFAASTESYEMKKKKMMTMMMMMGKRKGYSSSKGSFMMSSSNSSAKGYANSYKGQGGSDMTMMMSSKSTMPLTQISLGSMRPEGVTTGPGSIVHFRN